MTCILLVRRALKDDARNGLHTFRKPSVSSTTQARLRYSQYTTTYSPSHTTSTKCQYQAAPSNAK